MTLGLAGCATIYNPATQREETVISSSVESALGTMARAQMGLGSLNIGKAPLEQLARVQAIGERVAHVSDRQDVTYQFGVIRQKQINAFTLPGGTIYVYTGTIEKATDDELAAVIAHEVGHVAARHVAKHLQVDLGFGVLMTIAESAGVGAGSARMVNSIYDLLSRGFSRQDELEADRLGIRYAEKAGFDPNGMVSFFEKMLKEEPENPAERAMVWRQTHPLTRDRVAKAKEEIAKLDDVKFCPECGRTYGRQAQFCERDKTPLKMKSWAEHKS